MPAPAANENLVSLRTSGDQRVPERLYDQILDAPANLVLIESPFVDDLLEHLRQMAQRRGHSIYSWSAEAGLASLREHGITVSGSKRLSEALRFVLQSGHFGVYIFPAQKEEFTPQILALMRQIARGKDGGDKRVIVIGASLSVSSPLDKLARIIIHRHGLADKLRLRDGRWIRQ